MSTEEKKSEEPESEKRMTFLEHLLELRKRLMASVYGIVITTVVTLIFYEPVFAFLRKPLDDVNQEFKTNPSYVDLLVKKNFNPTQNIVEPITTDPLGLMMILMKISVYAGLVLASPWVLYQVWAFVAPGLTSKEAGAIRPVLLGGILFFVGGASFCYFIVFPRTIEFLVWFDVNLGFKPSYTPAEYFGMLTTFMLIFGATFELPLVSAIFARLGMLKPQWLLVFWRYIIVGCFVAGSILSPGADPISMIIMSLSLVFLYGMSIVLAKICYRKHQQAKSEQTNP
jgi:sec-independent protein translocase protein TatC